MVENHISTNRLRYIIYPLLIDIQILMNHGAQQHFFSPIGNRILCCSEILLESIKVLPESSTVNVR